jgi:hypothetical protein
LAKPEKETGGQLLQKNCPSNQKNDYIISRSDVNGNKPAVILAPQRWPDKAVVHVDAKVREMTPTTLADSRVQSALRHGVGALKRVANYVLPAALDQRLQKLGENKEYLGTAEHEELLALVTFTQERTIEKLEAELAMRDLQTLLPGEEQP